MRRKNAFTLIELLVVISIISLLIALVLPVLASSRESARRAVCASNARSLAQMFMIYEQDFKYFPSSSWSGMYRVMETNGRTLRDEYNVSEKITLCPSAAEFPSTYAKWSLNNSNSVGSRLGYFYFGGWGGRSINFNIRYGHYINGTGPYFPSDEALSLPPYGQSSDARIPSHAPLFMDHTYGTDRPYSSFNAKPTRSNHIKGDAAGNAEGQNVVMLDGHAEWQRMEPGVSWKLGKDYYDHIWWTPRFMDKPAYTTYMTP